MVLRGLPDTIVIDNGSEFTGRVLDAWANKHGVKLHFIDPGKPVQNAYVESFNGKFRDECLDLHWFTDLADAKAKIESWRVEYNRVRPHSSLDDESPQAFAGNWHQSRTAETAGILTKKVSKDGASSTEAGLSLRLV